MSHKTVLLKGGPWHDRLVALQPGKTELLVALAPELSVGLYLEDPDPIQPMAFEVVRYVPSGYEGYGPADTRIYQIWWVEIDR